MLSFKRLLLMSLSLVATTTAITCPNSWSKEDGQCCYGSMQDDSPNNKYCCVNDTPINFNFNMNASPTSTASESCFTKIPWTASDYSEQVSSASSKLAGATTNPATNEATPTSSGSAAATTNGAMPIATAQEIMLGGAAVLAGLFVL